MSVKKRLPLLVCLGLASVFLGFAAKYFWFSRPMGSGPAGPAVDARCFDKKWTEQKVLFLGVGDSVTAGFGVPAAYSYFGRLAKNPDDEFPDMRGLCLSAVLPNLEDPNIRGYDAIRRVFLREIAAVLGNSPAGGSEQEVP